MGWGPNSMSISRDWVDLFKPNFLWHFLWYSQGVRNSAKTLGAYISIYKACNPINLGAKWKLLFSSFQNCTWMWELDLNWQRYGKKPTPTWIAKNLQMNLLHLKNLLTLRHICGQVICAMCIPVTWGDGPWAVDDFRHWNFWIC